jgi:hypothetical protein
MIHDLHGPRASPAASASSAGAAGFPVRIVFVDFFRFPFVAKHGPFHKGTAPRQHLKIIK